MINRALFLLFIYETNLLHTLKPTNKYITSITTTCFFIVNDTQFFSTYSLSSCAVKLMKGERTVDNTCQKRWNDSQQSFKNFEYSLQTCSVLCCLHMTVFKATKISKTPLNNYTSIVQMTEYCSQVSHFIQTGSTVKCIMFSLTSSTQIHTITLN